MAPMHLVLRAALKRDKVILYKNLKFKLSVYYVLKSISVARAPMIVEISD